MSFTTNIWLTAWAWTKKKADQGACGASLQFVCYNCCTVHQQWLNPQSLIIKQEPHEVMFLEHMPNLKSMTPQYEGGCRICVTIRMDRVIPGIHSWEYFLMLLELASLILFELNSSFVIHFFIKWTPYLKVLNCILCILTYFQHSFTLVCWW